MRVTIKGDIRMLYTVTTTLPMSHGGRTQSLLRRIKLIDENLVYRLKSSLQIITAIIQVSISIFKGK